MKILFALCTAGLIGGVAYAGQWTEQVSAAAQGSHWYCVSEAPGNMQSSGHIGYGHGQTREQAARQAVEDCGRDGGFQCAAPQCWPE